MLYLQVFLLALFALRIRFRCVSCSLRCLSRGKTELARCSGVIGHHSGFLVREVFDHGPEVQGPLLGLTLARMIERMMSWSDQVKSAFFFWMLHFFFSAVLAHGQEMQKLSFPIMWMQQASGVSAQRPESQPE